MPAKTGPPEARSSPPGAAGARGTTTPDGLKPPRRRSAGRGATLRNHARRIQTNSFVRRRRGAKVWMARSGCERSHAMR